MIPGLTRNANSFAKAKGKRKAESKNDASGPSQKKPRVEKTSQNGSRLAHQSVENGTETVPMDTSVDGKDEKRTQEAPLAPQPKEETITSVELSKDQINVLIAAATTSDNLFIDGHTGQISSQCSDHICMNLADGSDLTA